MIVMTVGTFDTPHWGHINLLRECRYLSVNVHQLVVGLNPDWFIKKFKGHYPVMNYHERRMVLEAISYVSRVVPNTGGPDSKPCIEKVKPDYLVIGDDWLDKDYMKQMDFDEEWLTKMGIELVYIPYTREISSSEIRERCKRLS